MKIITGYTGERQITSDNDASIFTGIIGKKNYVLNSLNNFGYQLMGNNIIRINSGVMNYGGRYGIVEEYEDVIFENGKQGVTRTDMLVARYEKDELTGIESMKLVMITGTSAVEAKPLATDFPLYKITLNGINVASVTPQFDMLLSMQGLKALIESKANSITTAYTKSDASLSKEIEAVDEAYKKEVDSLRGSINQDLNDTNNRLDDMRKEMVQKYDSIENDINAVVRSVDVLADRITSLESKI